MARSAMQAGDQLRTLGDLAGALKQYRSAHALMHVPTTGLAVASTEAELQLLVEARSTAMEVINLPGGDQESAIFADARKAATELAAKLEPLVASIVVDVTPSKIPYSIELDGNLLPAEARHLALKTNPGRHVIEVRAPGYRSQLQEINVGESENIRMGIALMPMPLELALPDPVPKVTMLTPARVSTPSDLPPVGNTRAIISLTAGGALLLAGVAAGITSFVKTARIEPHCEDGYCGENRRAALSTANTYANIANITVPLGLLGIGYAVYEFLTSENSTPSARQDQAFFVRPQAVGVRW